MFLPIVNEYLGICLKNIERINFRKKMEKREKKPNLCPIF